MDRSLKVWTIFFFAVTLILTGINISIYLNKNEGFVYQQIPYNSIYVLDSEPSINKIINTSEDTIEIVLNGQALITRWMIYSESDLKSKVSGTNPKVFLPITGNNYIKEFKVCNETTGYCFNLKIQRQDIGDIHVIESSIPYTDVERYGFDDFCDLSWIDESEKNYVSDVVYNELKVDTCQNTLGKIKLLTSHIGNIAEKNIKVGLKYQWNTYTACQIYQKAREGLSKMTCNEFSEVYYVFANIAGIKTRRVGIVGFGDSDGIVKLSGHHFNESFIPEQNQWAFVDITSHKAFVLNEEMRALNTFELFMANISGNYEGLTSQTIDSDSTINEPYVQNRSNEEYYFSPNSLIQYKFGDDRFDLKNQFIRYVFLPEPVLSLNYNNTKFYIKKISILLLILTLTVSIVLVIRLLKKS